MRFEELPGYVQALILAKLAIEMKLAKAAASIIRQKFDNPTFANWVPGDEVKPAMSQARVGGRVN